MSLVVFDAIEVDSLRRGTSLSANPSGLTLMAMLELACSCVESDSLSEITSSWLETNHPWRDAMAWLKHGVVPASAPTWSSPRVELRGLQQDSDVETEWLLYLDRFRRSLHRAGFSKSLSAALSMALGEMADNIIQHSGSRGIVAFHVDEQYASWGAADVGCGALASLRTNPNWSHLQSSRDALLAIREQGATRRSSSTQGTGFRQVERSVASLNGRIRFRSGDAALVLEGAGPAPVSSIRPNPHLGGLQVAATVFLAPREKSRIAANY